LSTIFTCHKVGRGNIDVLLAEKDRRIEVYGIESLKIHCLIFPTMLRIYLFLIYKDYIFYVLEAQISRLPRRYGECLDELIYN
jgi:hypothetical protein